MAELLQTEKSYVKDLQECLEVRKKKPATKPRSTRHWISFHLSLSLSESDLPVGDDQRCGGDSPRYRQQRAHHLREHAGDLRLPQQVRDAKTVLNKVQNPFLKPLMVLKSQI